MFWCTPTNGCERRQLSGLVVRYNDLFEKSYAISACLDMENRDGPEPELLLESPGETPLVIEHKTVVWPKQYHRDHHNEHVIADNLHSLLGEAFQDDFYVLTLWAESLAGQRTLSCQALGSANRRRCFAGPTSVHIPRWYPWPNITVALTFGSICS